VLFRSSCGPTTCPRRCGWCGCSRSSRDGANRPGRWCTTPEGSARSDSLPRVMVKPGTSRARLVAHLLLNGPRHRAELARALSISRGTTTTIVQQLLQEGILVDGVDGVDGSGPATHDGPATSDRAASGRPDRSSRPAGEGTSGGGGVPGPAGPTGRTRLKQKLGISHRRGVFAHVTFQATASIVAITALDGRSWLTTSASAPPSPGPPTGWRSPT